MKRAEAQAYEDDLVYRLVELLLDADASSKAPTKMEALASELNEQFKPHKDLTRQSLVPLAAEALRRRMIRLVPPVSKDLRDQLKAKYPGLARPKVNVVLTSGPEDGSRVAAFAADRALDALLRCSQQKQKQGKPVGLGLGPGRATLEFCRFLSAALEHLPHDLQLRLVAITAGCPAQLVENAPISFLNLFPERHVETRLGLFAETLVPARDFPDLPRHIGVKEAFGAKDDIDVIVTAMGDFDDPHDLLRVFLKESGQDIERYRRRGWLGNVQYRPFTAEGPAQEEPDDLRAVTVFELQDLAKRALDRDKEVILMSRQCARCRRRRPRVRALRALIESDQLCVFTRLILDRATAVELLK
jgi:hypothetical protein